MSSFQPKRQIRGYIQVFELGTAQKVNNRIQQAIQVREAHEPIVDLNRDFFCALMILDSDQQQHQPWNSGRPEAKNKDQDNQSDQEHRSCQLGPVTHRLLLQPVRDPYGTVDQDDRRDEDRCEKHQLSEGIGDDGGSLVVRDSRDVRDVRAVRAVRVARVVAALEGGQHRRDGQRQKQNPDHNGNENGPFMHLEWVFYPWMDHAHVTVDGNNSQERNAGSSVQKQQKDDWLTNSVVVTPSLSTLKVVRPDWQANEQQDIRQDQIEQKNVVAFRFPEFEFKNEEVDHAEVQRKCQDKLHYHHGEVDPVQILTSSCTVVTRVVSHWY